MESVLLAGDRLAEFLLGHLRAAADAELGRPVHQFLLRAAQDVDAAGGPALVLPRPRAGGPLVGGTLVALRLPVVADLPERVLDRVESDPVGYLLVVVGVQGTVVRLGEGLLRLLG